MKIKKHISVILFLTTISLVAQIKIPESSFKKFKTLPKEQIFVHYNSNMVLTGESLLFKVYSLYRKTNTLSKLSKIAYIELLDVNKKPILKRKILLKGGEGYGDIFISSKIKSGNYKLIAYTRWMKNTNSYFEDNILIINPFEKKISFNHQTIKEKKEVYDFIYDTRSFVKINLKDLIDTDGKYSISIRKDNDGVLDKKKSPQNFYNLEKGTALSGTSVYLPEFRGQLIIGKITSVTNEKSVKNIKVGLSILDNDRIFKITSTDNKGNFFFNIAEPFRSEKIFCKLINENKPNNYKISFPREKELDFQDLSFSGPKTTNEIIKTINDRSIYIQIQNAYSEITKDSIIQSIVDNSIFKDKVIKYNLDDYTRFNTIKETFVEIIENAWIGKKDGKYKVFVRDSETITNFDFPPLIIVDGYIITDYLEFLDINPKKIQSISLLREKYKYNSKPYQGIISLKSKKGSYTPRAFKSMMAHSFLTTLPIKKYSHKKDLNNSNTRIPDFRTQLLWKPKVTSLNKNISFRTSDIKGKYIIEVQGFSKKGTPISIIKTLQVK